MSRDSLLRLLAAAFSGYILYWVSPPQGLHWLHWGSFVPLYLALDPENGRRSFKIGYFSGFIAIFALFFWLAQTIDIFSNIPLALASIVVMLFALVWGLPYGVLATMIHPLRRRFGNGWIFLYPACQVGIELLWPSLFPYYQGVSQYRVHSTWQLASVFGAYGLSYLIILTNCAIATALPIPNNPLRSGGVPWAHLGIVAALFLGNIGFGTWRFDAVEEALQKAPVANVSILQQKITMVDRLEDMRRDHGKTAFGSWVERTRKVSGQPIDLVVWPEGAVPFNPAGGQAEKVIGAIAKEGNFNLLVGGGTGERDPATKKYTSWNSCYLFDREGKIGGRYDKMVPLPFGEYLPWPFVYLKDYIEGVGDFQAGTTPTLFKTDRFSFSVPICYEAILERQIRNLMDAEVFVNITNDGWFGDTAAPHQHAMLSAIHAVQFGRPMLRIAYTGISMIVEPHGVIKNETAPYTDVAEVVQLRVATFDTPYRTWGGFFPWVCTVVAAGALWLSRGRKEGV